MLYKQIEVYAYFTVVIISTMFILYALSHKIMFAVLDV